MNFTGGTNNKLPPKKIEEVKELLAEFYRHYAEIALPGQLVFIDSVYEQFNTKQYLSDKQISAIENVLNSCAAAKEEDTEDRNW